MNSFTTFSAVKQGCINDEYLPIDVVPLISPNIALACLTTIPRGRGAGGAGQVTAGLIAAVLVMQEPVESQLQSSSHIPAKERWLRFLSARLGLVSNHFLIGTHLKHN